MILGSVVVLCVYVCLCFVSASPGNAASAFEGEASEMRLFLLEPGRKYASPAPRTARLLARSSPFIFGGRGRTGLLGPPPGGVFFCVVRCLFFLFFFGGIYFICWVWDCYCFVHVVLSFCCFLFAFGVSLRVFCFS